MIPTFGSKAHVTSCDDQSTPFEPVRVIDKQSLEYVIRSGIAGGLAGSAAKTLIAPLDRVKILFQTANPDFLQFRGKFSGLFQASRQIWVNDGVMGLFQGHFATLLRIFPYAAIKFVAYEQIRTVLIPTDHHETAIRRFMAGSLSGLASVFLTYPLDLIRVRMAFDTNHVSCKDSHHNSSLGILRHRGKLLSTISVVFNEKPVERSPNSWLSRFKREHLPTRVASISNFYRGFAPTVFGMIPYAGVSFYTHDLIHDVFRSRHLAAYTVRSVPQVSEPLVPANKKIVKRSSKNKEEINSRDARVPLKAYAQLIAGGLAGMLSQTAAYPFEVIRRRMQVGGAVKDGRVFTFGETVAMIFKESGFKGFFVGLSIGYMKVIPMSACSFYVYERCKLMLGI